MSPLGPGRIPTTDAEWIMVLCREVEGCKSSIQESRREIAAVSADLTKFKDKLDRLFVGLLGITVTWLVSLIGLLLTKR